MAGAVALLGTGAGVAGWLAPPGRGVDGPVRVVTGASAAGYRRVAGAVADAPEAVAGLLEPATEAGLLILGLLLAFCWWTARGRGRPVRSRPRHSPASARCSRTGRARR
ncbi:hypothetical protein ACFQ0M_01225 [Kitasatospora aburaviensis]